MFKKLVQKVYHNLFNHRCEKVDYLKYYTYQDFPQMKEEKIAFKTTDDNILRGGIYYNQESIAEYQQIVVFCHGMWSGYLNYMTEIAMLVSRGFLVLAYDVTGTHESDGDGTKGFCLPLQDLQAAHAYIKNRDDSKNKKIAIIGHSWGGYTSLNSANLFDDISKIVAISPPLSLDTIMKTNFSLLYGLVKKEVIKIEEGYFGNLTELNGLDALKKDVDFLIIYSTDDQMVKDKYNYLPIRALGPLKNVQSIVFNDRSHHPHYTKEANQKYQALNERLKKYHHQKKTGDEIKELLKDVDWDQVVEQDQQLWDQIATFLKEKEAC